MSKGSVYMDREIKSQWEIAQIKRACEITDQAFSNVLSLIRPGISEREIADFLEQEMLGMGAGEVNKTIVAAGKNGACPHHWPTESIVQSGDFVTMDFGCTFHGYHSDLTRTVVVGTPTERQRRIYDTVAKAQLAGIAAVRAGIKGKEADQAARRIIDATEFRGTFLHGLGHGIGLSIHEGTGLGKEEEGILKAGMVVSIEPGIYIEGYGGVRIEDIAVVTEEGAELLEFSPKELIIL
ncbi:MAG: M24 family metallopeptidase [Lachnospiraceae bacterium]